ncbi:hypothetical protein I4U23_010965 [Adineta vaga]|nr:hypothetical protein I4U23_010965 [Adineta vaga]
MNVSTHQIANIIIDYSIIVLTSISIEQTCILLLKEYIRVQPDHLFSIDTLYDGIYCQIHAYLLWASTSYSIALYAATGDYYYTLRKLKKQGDNNLICAANATGPVHRAPIALSPSKLNVAETAYEATVRISATLQGNLAETFKAPTK